MRLVRVGVAPSLTRAETQELRAHASADLRSIGNYVSHLVTQDLKGKGARRGVANPGEKRRPCFLGLYFTPAEQKKLEAQARAERRSVSGYVARVIVGELTGR